MSCPYFNPAEPHPRAEPTAARAMLPLGGTWTGTCHADPHELVRPDDTSLQRLCNLGYARGVCPRFPAADSGPDAARFTISGDDGASLRIYYVLERNHEPFAHGPLEFSVERRNCTPQPAGEWTAQQAAAYAASYLRSKAAAAAA